MTAATTALVVTASSALAQAPCRNTGAFAPWLDQFKQEALAKGISRDALAQAAPHLTLEAHLIDRQHQSILSFYGHEHGNRIARKHLGWVIERKTEERHLTPGAAASWRRKLLGESDNAKVGLALCDLFATLQDGEKRAA